EDEAIKMMEAVERNQSEVKDLTALLDSERAKLASMKEQIGDEIARLQGEIEALRPAREEAAAAVPARAREAFDRLAERFDGESLSPLSKPNPRNEEY